MSYLVTGATTVMGRSLVSRLLAHHDGTVFILAPRSAGPAIGHLRATSPAQHRDRIVHTGFDEEQPAGGVAPGDLTRVRGNVRHVFHLAGAAAANARPDLTTASTRAALDVATAIGAEHVHLLSSTLAAADDTREPLHRTVAALRDAEALVRGCGTAWRIYRSGVVIGRADTGEADPDDPLSAMFTAARAVAEALPAWIPLPAPPLGTVPVVPADAVAVALEELAHRPGLDARCIDLPAHDIPVVELLNEVARLAGGPRLVWPVDPTTIADLLPRERFEMLRFWPQPAEFVGMLLEMVGFPPALTVLAAPDTGSGRDTATIDTSPVGSHMVAPSFPSYADRLWRYWEQHLDRRAHPPTLAEVVEGKVALVTGASTGIGRAAALKLGGAGARVLLVARREDALREVARDIAAAGGRADVHAADLSTTDAARALADDALATHGRVDILVNNAGLSLNRAIADSVERVSDFERTMAVNYFGPVALVLGLLPSLRAHGGHIVNVLSGLVQAPAPGFAAYGASKAAFDNFAHVLRAEVGDDGIAVTNVYMGLVHTAMSDPTEAFRRMSALDSTAAADVICDAIVRRPVIVSVEPLAALHGVLWALWPTGAAALLGSVTRSMPWRREPREGPGTAPTSDERPRQA